jgi:hypothetical protein
VVFILCENFGNWFQVELQLGLVVQPAPVESVPAFFPWDKVAEE